MFVKHFEILGWKVLLKCKILWLLDIIIPCTVFHYTNSTTCDSQIGWQHFKLHCCLPINLFYFDVRSKRYPRAIMHHWHKSTWQMWLLGECRDISKPRWTWDFSGALCANNTYCNFMISFFSYNKRNPLHFFLNQFNTMRKISSCNIPWLFNQASVQLSNLLILAKAKCLNASRVRQVLIKLSM